MLDKGACLRFYKRRDIQEAIVAHAKNKEIGFRFGDGFGKRPDLLSYPQEIIELAKQGVTSFHASEECWENPLDLNSNLGRKELDKLRTGWDLVLDLDCKLIDYSKIAADLIVKFLKYCGVKDYSCKFSGNKGFHLGIPFEAFPQTVGPLFTKDLFPEAAKEIAFYIKENIKEELGKRILEFENNNFSQIIEKVGLPQEKIIRYEQNQFGDKIAKLDVDKFLEIDTVLISSRHLYRMPYSLHEKSGLVSLPIDPDKVMEFKKEMAHPDVILAPMFVFLDRKVTEESARRLLVRALDFKAEIKESKNQENEKKIWNENEEIKIECPIKEEFFPPCMLNYLNGLEDGKKRAAFCLMNFLGKISWSKPEIEGYLQNWNREKNREPLREVYLKGQMNTFQPGEKLPPNCSNEAYYSGLGLCKADALCRKIKNPVNYTILKWKSHLRDKEEEENKGKMKKKEKIKTASPPTTPNLPQQI